MIWMSQHFLRIASFERTFQIIPLILTNYQEVVVYYAEKG